MLSALLLVSRAVAASWPRGPVRPRSGRAPPTSHALLRVLVVHAVLAWAHPSAASGVEPVGRRLTEATTATVSDVTALGDAVGNSLITRIVVDPGYYDLTSISCGSSWKTARLCVDHPVTIEAAVNGTVVLDGRKQGDLRIFFIDGSGVELVGLNITGGIDSAVRARLFELLQCPARG